jgi:hypothetical protein
MAIEGIATSSNARNLIQKIFVPSQYAKESVLSSWLPGKGMIK